MAESLIILDHLAVGYSGRAVLRDIHATIARGESIGLLGANGSGKTTLLKTIAGILPPLSGEVRFGLTKHPVVGYVPQRESLDQSFMLSSFEIVLLGTCGRVGPARFLSRSDREFARECLDRTGTADLEKRRFAELSGGQKQRILIARALAAKPDLLLLDEPTAGVDPAATTAIAELLQRLNAEGLTVFMVNHDLPVVRRVSRTVFWAKDGKVEQGAISKMLSPTPSGQLSIN